MKGVLIFCSLILMSVATKKNKDKKNEVHVMQALSASLGEMVLECQTELEFKHEVVEDLLDFWNEKNNLVSEDLGCALVCVFEKNEFLSPDGTKVQKDKVFAFYKAAGADDIMSGQLVDLLLLCKNRTSSIKSFCDSALEMVKCYRYGIFTMHWNPERFYWQHSQLPSSQQVYNKHKCKGPVCKDISETELFNNLFRSC